MIEIKILPMPAIQYISCPFPKLWKSTPYTEVLANGVVTSCYLVFIYITTPTFARGFGLFKFVSPLDLIVFLKLYYLAPV